MKKEVDMLKKIIQRTAFLLMSLFIPAVLFPNQAKVARYLYDANQVRYELYQANGGQPYNWLFFPGGPGSDSIYLHSLIDELKLPGNVWLVDLPGSGSNIQGGFSENFDQWMVIFPEIIKQFDHPVLVGHSFGGMFPLLFPEIEEYLKGFVILHSSPVLWTEEATTYAKQFGLPDFSREIQAFILNPNQETFEAALSVCMPYYFPKETLEKGKKMFSQGAFQYQPAIWWLKKSIELNFSAEWIPQKIPTLIVGGKYDCICPFSLFEKDERFKRDNIELFFIENAGHAGWIENPDAVRTAFEQFITRLEIE